MPWHIIHTCTSPDERGSMGIRVPVNVGTCTCPRTCERGVTQIAGTNSIASGGHQSSLFQLHLVSYGGSHLVSPVSGRQKYVSPALRDSTAAHPDCNVPAYDWSIHSGSPSSRRVRKLVVRELPTFPRGCSNESEARIPGATACTGVLTRHPIHGPRAASGAWGGYICEPASTRCRCHSLLLR